MDKVGGGVGNMRLDVALLLSGRIIMTWQGLIYTSAAPLLRSKFPDPSSADPAILLSLNYRGEMCLMDQDQDWG